MIEPHANIPSNFQVLFLILAHRHNFSLIEQDVSRHQYRIGKQAMAWGNPLGYLVLIRVAALKKSHGGES